MRYSKAVFAGECWSISLNESGKEPTKHTKDAKPEFIFPNLRDLRGLRGEESFFS